MPTPRAGRSLLLSQLRGRDIVDTGLAGFHTQLKGVPASPLLRTLGHSLCGIPWPVQFEPDSYLVREGRRVKFAQLIGRRGFWSLLPLGTSPSGLQRGALCLAGAGPRFPFPEPSSLPIFGSALPASLLPFPSVCLSIGPGSPRAPWVPADLTSPTPPPPSARVWGEWRAQGCPLPPLPCHLPPFRAQPGRREGGEHGCPTLGLPGSRSGSWAVRKGNGNQEVGSRAAVLRYKQASTPGAALCSPQP